MSVFTIFKKTKTLVVPFFFTFLFFLGGLLPVEAAVFHIVPEADSTGVPLNTSLVVTFDTDMDWSTITSDTFYLDNSVNGVVTTNSGHLTATLTPALDLTAGTTYTCTMTTGILDADNDPIFTQNYTWTFSTGSDSNTTAPQITSISPTNGQKDLSETPLIAAFFDKYIQPSTLTTDSFYVNQGIVGSISYDPEQQKATFSLNKSLDNNKTYTVTITTDVKDIYDNNLAADYSWSFTTQDEGGCFINLIKK